MQGLRIAATRNILPVPQPQRPAIRMDVSAPSDAFAQKFQLQPPRLVQVLPAPTCHLAPGVSDVFLAAHLVPIDSRFCLPGEPPGLSELDSPVELTSHTIGLPLEVQSNCAAVRESQRTLKCGRDKAQPMDQNPGPRLPRGLAQRIRKPEGPLPGPPRLLAPKPMFHSGHVAGLHTLAVLIAASQHRIQSNDGRLAADPRQGVQKGERQRFDPHLGWCAIFQRHPWHRDTQAPRPGLWGPVQLSRISGRVLWRHWGHAALHSGKCERRDVRILPPGGLCTELGSHRAGAFSQCSGGSDRTRLRGREGANVNGVRDAEQRYAVQRQGRLAAEDSVRPLKPDCRSQS